MSEKKFENQSLADLAYKSRFGVYESRVENVGEQLRRGLEWSIAQPDIQISRQAERSAGFSENKDLASGPRVTSCTAARVFS